MNITTLGERLRFRAWDKRVRLMRVVESLDFNTGSIWFDTVALLPTGEIDRRFEEGNFLFFGESGSTDKEIMIKLMQYIGLRDVTNQEIYTGDILEDTFGQRAEARAFTDEAHCMSGFHLIDLNNNRTGGWSVFDGSWLKLEARIIGNIYEHPDLITQKDTLRKQK